MNLKQSIKNSLQRKRERYKKSVYEREITRIKNLPRYTADYTSILGKPFKFHDNLSFLQTYEELFSHKIYSFNSSIENDGVIIDCGANMGLSVLFFASNYPNHKIIAFEPDSFLFDIITENVKSFDMQNVQLINKAVWTEETTLNFYTDGGMGGRINRDYKSQQPTKVQAVALADFLRGSEIDFLKIDIEGAETDVIFACTDELKNVNYLFFEYHNVIGRKQRLHDLLELVSRQGFSYYIKESAVVVRPFVEKPVICETFDMALNVFCYRTEAF